MVSVIHIPDKTYKLSCRILYQYLLLAQGQFHDLKQLFMSANNNSTPSSNSSPEGKNTDQSLMEKAGLSESEVEPLEENSKDCVVCQNGTVNWVLLPCRHTCLCDGCVKYFQQCPMCRQFVQESFALCSQKEQDKDKLKSLWGCCYYWKVHFPLKMQTYVLRINHNMESTVLNISENSVLTSYLYMVHGWWKWVIPCCSLWQTLESYSVSTHKNSSNSREECKRLDFYQLVDFM